jgi:hypothetical protein
MLQITVGDHTDALEQSIESLKEALAFRVTGQESRWIEDVGDAIDGIHKRLRQHIVMAQAADGLFTEVDATRPTLVRQTDDLRREHSNLMGQVLALREEVHRAKQTISASAKSPLNERGSVPQSPDLGAFRRGAEKLLADLQQILNAETALLMESVNTDIGVGD